MPQLRKLQWSTPPLSFVADVAHLLQRSLPNVQADQDVAYAAAQSASKFVRRVTRLAWELFVVPEGRTTLEGRDLVATLAVLRAREDVLAKANVAAPRTGAEDEEECSCAPTGDATASASNDKDDVW